MKKIFLIVIVAGALTVNAQERSEALRLGTNTGQVQPPSAGKVDFSGITVLGLPGATTPTGTGFRHVTLGIEDAAAKLVADADISATAAIAWTKVSKTGASLADLPTRRLSSLQPDPDGTALFSGTKFEISSSPYHLTFGFNGPNIGSNLYNDGSWRYRATGPGMIWGLAGGGGDFAIFQAPSGTANTVATLNQIFTAFNDGGVSVGGVVSPGNGNLSINGLAASSFVETNASKVLITRTAPQMRGDLALGDAAQKNTGTTAGTLAAGDDGRFTDDRTANAIRSLTSHAIDNAADPTDQQVFYFEAASGKLKFKTLSSGGNVNGSGLTSGNVLQGSGGTNIADGGFAITDIARLSVADVFTNLAAPATPAAGKTTLWFDITAKNIFVKNDAGTVNHGVQTKTAATHKALSAIADSGAVTDVQLASIDLSDFSVTAANADGQIPIWDNAQAKFIPGDPKVQGLTAEGSTTTSNPINIGGYNTAGTPALHGANVQNATPGGTDYGIVTRPIPSGTQTVSGTVTTTPPANASSNITQWAGTAVSTNSGTKDAGTLRIVIATDQPALSNALSISGTVTANAGTGTFNNQQSNVTADYDSGAGTQNLTMFGLALPASGGAVAGGTTTNPFRIDPTGTTTQPVSGTVTANGGTNLNTALLALEGGGNLATLSSAVRAEDTASADADKGIGLLAVRKSTPANTSGTDGDYEYLQLSAGRLWVSAAIDTAIPAGGNTIGAVTQASGPWSQNVTQYAGNALVTVATGVPKFGVADSTGAAFLSAANALNSTGSGVQASQVVGQFDDVSPTSITENQFGNLRMSANRNAYTTLRDAAGNERGANVNANNQLSISLDNVAYNTGTRSATTQRVTISTDDVVAITPSGTFNVTPAATENVLGFVGGKATIVSANFTRPANTTAYASGDIVANNTTAASVMPLSFTASRINDASGMIRRVKLKKSGTSVTNAQFRIHLYQTDPSASSGIVNGDNGVWSTKEASYLGYFDVASMMAFSDGAAGYGAPAVGSEVNFIPSSGTQTIYGLIEARAAYTPGSAEVFTVYLEDLQN